MEHVFNGMITHTVGVTHASLLGAKLFVKILCRAHALECSADCLSCASANIIKFVIYVQIFCVGENLSRLLFIESERAPAHFMGAERCR